MIEQVVLDNMQGHEHSELVLHKGFNLIVGVSGHGKTSILRGFDWLRTNTPAGATISHNFIRWGADKVAVGVQVNGKILWRTRDANSTGHYFVDDKVFSVMGRDVPEAVSEVLNMSDINIQYQLDSHFLILETPGRAATYINSVTKLDKVTDGLAAIKGLKSDNKTASALVAQKVVESTSFLDSDYGDKIDQLDLLYFQLLASTKCRNEVVEEWTATRKLVKWVEVAQVEVAKWEALPELVHVMERAASCMESINSQYDIISLVEKLCDNVIQAETENTKNKLLPQLESPMAQLGSIATILIQITEQYQTDKALVDTLQDAMQQHDVCMNALNRHSKLFLEAKAQLNECPYCGNELDTNHFQILMGK